MTTAIATTLRAAATKRSVCEDEVEYVVELLTALHEDADAADVAALARAIEESLEVVVWLDASKLSTLSLALARQLMDTGDDDDDATQETDVERDFLEHLQDEYAIDKRCLAVLSEDDDWHPARITKHLPTKQPAADSTELLQLEVEFTEYGKRQIVPLEDVVLEEDIADGEGDSVSAHDAAVCEMCERPMRLTFHHLIPRVTHAKFLKLGYSREYLNSGVMICRPCHSKIHSTESNKTLAREFNTLEKLVAHPEIARWIHYARKQRVSSRPVKRQKWPTTLRT
ncbi:hypothetical protein PINS_up012666 [Pythium insidiosum]|nr:hypothetical protein PINS_up012666 [Pythium insidiosum]